MARIVRRTPRFTIEILSMFCYGPQDIKQSDLNLINLRYNFTYDESKVTTKDQINRHIFLSELELEMITNQFFNNEINEQDRWLKLFDRDWLTESIALLKINYKKHLP